MGRFWKGFLTGALVVAAALVYAASRTDVQTDMSRSAGRRLKVAGRVMGKEARQMASIYERGRRALSRTAKLVDSKN